jgi:signal transduction histidine kinase
MTLGGSPWASRPVFANVYWVAIRLYLAGLVVWLVLGLLPVQGGAESAEEAMSSPSAIVVAYVFSVLNLALGVFLMVKRPNDLVPRLLTLAFLGTAATFNGPSHRVFHLLGEPAGVKVIHFAFHVVSGTAYVFAVLLFPDGRLPWRWGGPRLRGFLLAGLAAAVVLVCWRSSFISHPPFFVVFFGALVPVAGIVAQTVKMRSGQDVRADAQSRLLRAALLPALVVALVWVGGRLLSWWDPVSSFGAEISDDVQQAFPAVFALVPVVLFFAILKLGLWDIDVVVSRVLLLGVLVAVLTAGYVVVLAGTGMLAGGARGWRVLVPLVAVACVAEPLRRRAHRLCNRLVFGQQASPREAILSLVERFDGMGDVDELGELVRVVVSGTRATSAELWVAGPGEMVLIARHPAGSPLLPQRVPGGPEERPFREAVAPARTWPVLHEGVLLATMAVTTPRGVSVTPRESRLLDDLSHHAALLVRNAQLTVDLARELEVVTHRAAALRESRREVVVAQDRQRHRLERDIHDGAQQHLVALIIGLRALRARAGIGPVASDDVVPLRSALRETQETVGELASGGAPRVLVDAGLEVALRSVAAGLDLAGPSVDVRAAVPRLTRDVETAVYFCCVEAVQNAVKHAHASVVRIEVRTSTGRLVFSVSDDGRGFGDSARPSSGLSNLESRLLPLGGRVEVESVVGRGTTVTGEVPLLDVHEEPATQDALEQMAHA